MNKTLSSIGLTLIGIYFIHPSTYILLFAIALAILTQSLD